MDRKIDWLARRDGPLIQVRGTNDEWPWPIGKSAGPCARRCRLEDARVVFRRCGRAKDAAERASQNVSRESCGKMDGIARGEVQPALFKIERHFSISRTLVASSSVENGFCKK